MPTSPDSRSAIVRFRIEDIKRIEGLRSTNFSTGADTNIFSESEMKATISGLAAILLLGIYVHFIIREILVIYCHGRQNGWSCSRPTHPRLLV